MTDKLTRRPHNANRYPKVSQQTPGTHRKATARPHRIVAHTKRRKRRRNEKRTEKEEERRRKEKKNNRIEMEC